MRRLERVALCALLLLAGGRCWAQPAVLTTPPPGSALSGASVTFAWTTGTGVTQYYLYVGTGLGLNDIYGQDQGTSRSVTVNNLPTDGRTLYVRLWSFLGAGWQFNDYTYTALSGKAVLTAPTPGSTLSGSSVTFIWTAGTGASQYYLYVGSTFGANDIFGQSPGTSLSVTVSNLPTDSRTLYVRLWSFIGAGWFFNDYTYSAFSGKAVLTTPAPGSRLWGSAATFGWTAGTGVDQYYLYVGSSAGANDIFGQSPGTSHSVTVNNLPTDGRTLYVRLWSHFASGWQFNDYTYRAAGAGTRFSTTAPCRLFDTREFSGPEAASPALAPGETRLFTISGRCGIPASATSLAVNQTVTGQTSSGALVLYRGDLSSAPGASSISYKLGTTRANNGILELSHDGNGTFKVFNDSTGIVHFVLDVGGYFQ